MVFSPEKLRHLVFPAALAVAFWPVLRWWVERTADSSDAAVGLVALGLVVVTCARESARAFGAGSNAGSGRLELGLLGTALVVAYAATFWVAPNLVRALFAAGVIGVVAGRARGVGPAHFGTWGLVAMTLPVLSSLDFFLGYPLRWVTTQLTALLLRLGGIIVETDGLALVMGPVEVWVDGPCSGVKMLWVGVFLAAGLAFVFRLRNWATVSLFLIAVVATVAGNVSRAAGVFYLESGIIDAPAVAHDLTGIAAFAVVAGGVAAAGFWLRNASVDVVESGPANDAAKTANGTTANDASSVRKPNVATTARSSSRIRTLQTSVAIAAAAIVPFFVPASNATVDVPFEGWPAELDGARLEPRELSERDKPYLAGFPGRIAAFRTGEEEVLMRWITTPSRRLHSAADCYRGLGWDVTPMKSDSGWARFEVVKGDQRLDVRERITDVDGTHFAEVGAWYWAGMLGTSEGPWRNVVRVKTAEPR